MEHLGSGVPALYPGITHYAISPGYKFHLAANRARPSAGRAVSACRRVGCDDLQPGEGRAVAGYVAREQWVAANQRVRTDDTSTPGRRIRRRPRRPHA